MARPRNLIPTLRVHAASGQAFVEIAGLRKYLGPADGPDTQRAYEVLKVEVRANGGSFTPPADAFDIVDLCAYALERGKVQYADGVGGTTSSQTMLRQSLKRLAKLYGPELARDFTSKKLATLRESMVGERLSANTIGKVLLYVRMAFNWAAEDGRVPDAVADSLAKVRNPRTNDPRLPAVEPIDAADPAVVAKTIPLLSPTLQAMIGIQLLTGMRPGEVCRMTPGEIDRSGPTWWYEPSRHKLAWRGKKRRVPLGPKCRQLLEAFIDRDADQPLFSPVESMAWHLWQRRLARVTPASCGNTIGSNRRRKPKRTPGLAYTANSYAHAIRRACERAEPALPVWGPNQIRKLVATQVAQDHGALAAALLLGHSSARVTEAHYITRAGDELKRLAQ